MYDFFGEKVEEMGVANVAKILLAIGVIGIIIVVSLIVWVIKDTQHKKEELRNAPQKENKTEELLKESGFDSLNSNLFNFGNGLGGQ